MGSKRELDPWAVRRGAEMKAARERLRKSQPEIAKLVGVTREAISQYEKGVIKDIPVATIPKLAKALGMHPHQLSRHEWKAVDEALDLRVSTVARQIAYAFDDYPLFLQNQIREAIARYEALVREHGREKVEALYGPIPAPPPRSKVVHVSTPEKRGRRVG